MECFCVRLSFLEPHMFSRSKVGLSIGGIISFFLSFSASLDFSFSFSRILSYCSLIRSQGFNLASFYSSSRVGTIRESLSADSKSSTFGVSGRFNPFKRSSNSLVWSASLGTLGSLLTSRPRIFDGSKSKAFDDIFLVIG
jgi:hypothetical protein